MIITETSLSGVFQIELEKREDKRGYFARTWCEKEFREHGLETGFTQGSLSFNKHSGTLRGLHYQVSPHWEVKLVRCIRGSIFDVVVDLRRDSNTYLNWFSAELSETNQHSLYIPKGCAHGFQTLVDDCEVLYQIGPAYQPETQRGIAWNDPAIGIAWPTVPKEISERDLSYPHLGHSVP